MTTQWIPISCKLTFLSSLLNLAACEIAGRKRGVDPNENNTKSIFTFVTVEQFAVNVPNISNALSGLSGYSVVAPKDSSFNAWANPANACMYLRQDGVFSPERLIDIGLMKLSGFGIQETQMPLDPESGTFGVSGRLPAGTYELNSAGNSRGKFAFTQDFKVLNEASHIKLTSSLSGIGQSVPSPHFPDEGDADYLVVINKNESLKIEYQAPANTTYVRTKIFDGSNQDSGAIICYSTPLTPTQVPAGMMNYFRQTDDGAILIDFVNVSLKTDATGLKESFIQSYVRHVHGMREYFLSDEKLTLRYGKLRFQ